MRSTSSARRRGETPLEDTQGLTHDEDPYQPDTIPSPTPNAPHTSRHNTTTRRDPTRAHRLQTDRATPRRPIGTLARTLGPAALSTSIQLVLLLRRRHQARYVDRGRGRPSRRARQGLDRHRRQGTLVHRLVTHRRPFGEAVPRALVQSSTSARRQVGLDGTRGRHHHRQGSRARDALVAHRQVLPWTHRQCNQE